MGRPLRIEFPGAFYHVTSRGNERKNIFRDNVDREIFLGLLGRTVEDFHLSLHAYVMMANHYHLLVETPRAGLSKALKFLNGVYTQAFNRRHQRVGHLFQGRYKSILVDKDSYLLELSRYIHLNPWRIKESQNPFSFKWSSLRAYSGLSANPKWLTTSEVLEHFRPGGKKDYRAFVKESMTHGINSPWSKVKGQTLLGSEPFINSIVRRYFKGANELQTETAHRKELAMSVGPEQLLKEVVKHFGIKIGDLKRRSHVFTEPRYVASYLLRKYCSTGLKEIGEHVGLHYSAVGNAIRLLRERPTPPMVKALNQLEGKIKNRET